MRTLYDVVLARSFDEKGIIVSKTTSGISFVGNYETLVHSVALADGPDGIKTGDIIYVKGTSVKAPWARLIFALADGQKGVLVPRLDVVLVEAAPAYVDRPRPLPTSIPGLRYENFSGWVREG